MVNVSLMMFILLQEGHGGKTPGLPISSELIDWC